jgi:putative glycosyltransferase (TIGR04372 family)
VKIKNIIKNYYFFLFIIHIANIFNFLKYKKKLNNLNNFRLSDKNKKHVNKDTEAKRINLIFSYLEIEKYVDNFNRNIQAFDLVYFTGLKLSKYTYLSIYIKIFSSLHATSKKFKNLSYLIYLIILNKSNFFSQKTKYFNYEEKNLVKYLKDSFLLKNLTIINKSVKEKKKIIISYLMSYNDELSTKNLEMAVEHSISDHQLLKKIQKRGSTFKNFYKLNKNHYLGSSLYAYGHLMNMLEIIYRGKIKNNIIISPYYIANSFLGKYLKVKYPKKVNISHLEFLKKLDKRLIDTSLNNEEINNKNSIYYLSYNEFKLQKKISSILDLTIVNNLFKKSGLKKIIKNEKYVCINIRDPYFKHYDKKVLSNLDRLVIPEYIEKFIEYLNNKKLKVILLNGFIKKDLSNFNITNYPQSTYKNDVNDILLLKDCEFIINFGQTSSTVQDLLFNKFSLHLDYPLNRKPIFNPKAFYCPRPFYKKRKRLKLKDFFNNDLYINHDYQILKDKGYILSYSTYKENINNLEKFLKIIKGKNKRSFKKVNNFKYPINII